MSLIEVPFPDLPMQGQSTQSALEVSGRIPIGKRPSGNRTRRATDNAPHQAASLSAVGGFDLPTRAWPLKIVAWLQVVNSIFASQEIVAVASYKDIAEAIRAEGLSSTWSLSDWLAETVAKDLPLETKSRVRVVGRLIRLERHPLRELVMEIQFTEFCDCAVRSDRFPCNAL
jgi:hypothetical protein